MSIASPLADRALTPFDVAALSDDELIAGQRSAALALRQAEANAAVLAAEIGRRSHPDFGSTGLAQALGARKPDLLVAQLTGLSGADARKLVRVGTLVAEPSVWMAPVAAAVTSGDLSLAAADVIRAGLGEPGRVAADDLLDAAKQLVADAPRLTFEQLAAGARDARTALDLEGVPAREQELRDRRWLSFTPLPNGNYRVAGELDAESKAVICGPLDAIVAPQRGGPRFVDPANEPAADTAAESGALGPEYAPELVDDRSIPQMLVDGLVDLVKIATLADPRRVIGTRRVGVRLHVSQRDLSTGTGVARIEGDNATVSVATAQRIACDTGLIPVVFDTDGQVLNVGRQQRLHTPRMRIAIAARDGGCIMAACSRPPEMCEVHHINEWERDGGETSVQDGVLLCRHHHMLFHNNGWHVERDRANYTIVTPKGQRIAVRAKNPTLARVHDRAGA